MGLGARARQTVEIRQARHDQRAAQTRPDRERNEIGSDNNYEYKLIGYFSGETVYEPASDGFYPEFILQGYEIRNVNPASIYSTKRQNDPTVRILAPPL